MWQEIAVYVILVVGACSTLWSFYGKFTGKASCCGGGCTCRSGQPKPGKSASCKGGKNPCGCATANG